MEHTQNYQLNQYEPGDSFLRTDFNEDNAKTDAALTRKCEIVTGTYIGNDQYPRAISLGFAPKALILERCNGLRGNSTPLGGLIFQNAALMNGTYQSAYQTDDGFVVQQDSLNNKGTLYYYLAFR